MKSISTASEGLKRVIIKNITPAVSNGDYPAKATEGSPIYINATIITDGHDTIYAQVAYRYSEKKGWETKPLKAGHNDQWTAVLLPEHQGKIEFRIQAWTSELATWKNDFQKKAKARMDTFLERKKGFELFERHIGFLSKATQKTARGLLSTLKDESVTPDSFPEEIWLELISTSRKEAVTTSNIFEVIVERKKAQFSTWYELFPRSCSTVAGQHGTFLDVIQKLPSLSAAGFDVLYLPPIHPIGRIKRKGKNNNITSMPGEPGSPWAIGSSEGGHKSLHPELGSMENFKQLLKEAKKQHMEIAMDIAFQCAPDHPYVKEHPEWFKWRSDGTVQFAENPPKKYEDILPFDFDSLSWASLWEELLSIFIFWIKAGVRIFRVDNPHTKSLRLWEWLIASVKQEYPDVIFLAEAFTRQHVMEHLAMIGFTQSYTYFTWRVTKKELEDYLVELTEGPKQFFFRPNFWPNTPDILPEHLVSGGDNMHIIRVMLAATLSSSYGIYGPVYERGINTPMPGKEEYIDNEKYEIRYWDPVEETRIWKAIKNVNLIRRRFAALQVTNNIQFLATSNDQIIAYMKYDKTGGQDLLIVVNLDPHHTQSAWVQLPASLPGRQAQRKLTVRDQFNPGEQYEWNGDWNYVELNPDHKPAHIFTLELNL